MIDPHEPAFCSKPIQAVGNRVWTVYGLGRFPVTLYREQWEKLLGMADEIRNFIREKTLP
jgi:hypothetical protein